MKNKAGTSRSVVVTLLSFMLSLLIACACAVGVLRVTVLDPAYAAKAVERSDFGPLELQRVREHFISYGLASNVEESFFTTFFAKNMTAEIIEGDMELSVRALYSGEDIIDEPYFYNVLYSSLTAYAKTRNMNTDDPEIDAGIKEFTTDLIELYRGYVTFPYADSISPLVRQVTDYVLPALAVFLVLAAACAVVIWMSYKRRTAPVSYIGSAFGGAGLMLVVMPLIILIGGLINKFTLTDEALRSFFIEFMTGSIVCLLISGLICIAVAAALFVRCKKLQTGKAKPLNTPQPD